MVHLSKNLQYGIVGALAVYVVFFTRPAPIAAPVIPESKEAPTEPLVAQETAPAPEIYERTFLVRCTRDQLIALGDFMNQNGIDFKKL